MGFWIDALCSVVIRFKLFEGPYCPHLQPPNISCVCPTNSPLPFPSNFFKIHHSELFSQSWWEFWGFHWSDFSSRGPLGCDAIFC